MTVKVAINGFGRIGRLAFRQMFGADGYDIVAINDLTNSRMLAHLLKYDSAQGKYTKEVTYKDGAIVVDGIEIKIYGCISIFRSFFDDSNRICDRQYIFFCNFITFVIYSC